MGALELAQLYRQKGIRVSRRVVITFTLMGLAMVAFIPESLDAVTGVAMVNSVLSVALVGSLAFNARHREVQGSAAAAGGALLGVAYLGMMFGFMVLVRREWSAWVLLWMIAATKASDIGAYFVGRSIGRHKLIPWLSPGKTWEGLAGGVLFSALVSGLLASISNAFEIAGIYQGTGADRQFVPHQFDLAAAVGSGLVFGLLGQFGDLTASLFKRDAGIKDSGATIPGFGGILDVVDSPIVVAPFAYWLLFLGVWSPGSVTI